MKKTQKKMLGLFGLFIVVAMTIVATIIPGPGVLAINSITDTITVTVVNGELNVDIDGITNGEVFLTDDAAATVTYANVKGLKLTLKHTDKNGNVTTSVVDEQEFESGSGTISYNIGALMSTYGYGNYVITAQGSGDDAFDEDSVSFRYYPVLADANEDEDTGKYYVDLEYGSEEEVESEDLTVEKLELNVYDGNGNLITGISPIKTAAPATKVEIPFDKANLPAGNYVIKVTAYNNKGEQLYTPYTVNIKYAPVPVPNTGSFFQGLNIAKTDYLVSGLIVFFVAAIGGIFIITRNNRKKNNSKSRH